jgi:hypothetical protein
VMTSFSWFSERVRRRGSACLSPLWTVRRSCHR